MPNSAPQGGSSWWRLLVQALKGEHYDYTSASLNRALILLSIPMVLEMIMESLFAITDVFWASRLGKEAVSVVGITESLMTIVYAVAIGISIAATAVVARRIGEKDEEAASHAAGQVLILGVVVSLGMGLIMGGLAPRILQWMGAEAKIVDLGSDFARLMLGGNITVFMIFLINAIFRGAGDAVIAMRTLWLANGLNMVLAPCFMFGVGPFPELGVTGAAVGTNLGRGIGVLYQLWHLSNGRHRIRVRWAHLRPDGKLIRSIASTASTGIAQFLISTTSWVGLVSILTKFGSAALAGYTISVRVVMFALLPAWGLSNAGATLVGQNLGAGKPDRAEASVWLATKFNMIFLSIVGLFFVLLAAPIVRIFEAHDSAVIAHGAQALWITGLGFPLYALGMSVTAAFNGAGDTRTPTLLNFVSFWCCEIPLGWFLAVPMGLGPTGVFIAIPIAFSLMALWSLILFRRGLWKLKKV